MLGHNHRFVLASLHIKCRRTVLLEYFGEEATTNDPSYRCCDVCESSNTTSDQSCEIKAVIQAIHDLPNSGEKKVNKMYMYCAPCTYIRMYICTITLYFMISLCYHYADCPVDSRFSSQNITKAP